MSNADENSESIAPGLARWWHFLKQHPHLALTLLATCATVLNCYPLLFFNKSLISPNNSKDIRLLYDRNLTLPNQTDLSFGNRQGADINATLYAFVPYSSMERTALAEGELPLWNRYSAGGLPLYGQGLSRLGDPLNWLPLIVGNRAWIWDLEYILARWVFCLGVGFLTYGLIRHLPTALILTCSAPFIGFFSYRYNHPAIFCLSYAPWMWCGWNLLETAATRWQHFRAGLVLVAATTFVWQSGAIKEGAMISLFLHSTCALIFLSKRKTLPHWKTQCLTGLAAFSLLALINVPYWYMLLHTKRLSFSSYDMPAAWQVPFPFLPGLLDDIFYQHIMPGNARWLPSGNTLVAFCSIWALVTWRNHRTPAFFCLVGSTLVVFGIVFGLVPRSVLLGIPVINNIHHIHNTFSCVLLLYLFALAGFGCRSFLNLIETSGWVRPWVTVSVIFLCLLGLYGITTHVFFDAFVYADALDYGPFVVGYAGLLLLTWVGFPFVAGKVMARQPSLRAQILLAATVLILTGGRFGMHLATRTQADNYLLVPGTRINLDEPTPALRFLQNELTRQPGRALGFTRNLCPGYSAVHGLEHICGPDALQIAAYFDLLDAGGIERNGQWWYGVTPENLPANHPVLNLLNIRFLVTTPEAPGNFPGLIERANLDLKILENQSAWPRAFFSSSLQQYGQVDELIAQVRANQGAPLAAVSTTERSLPPLPGSLFSNHPKATIIPAENYRLTSNTTEFTISAPQAGVAVLTETYLPDDFRVTLNGQPTPYFRVNHAFKGVMIPQAGSYHILFEYRPPFLTASLRAALTGMGLLVGWGIWAALKKTAPTEG